MSTVEMAYSGEMLLKDLNRLRSVKSMKDVKDITHTQFPGVHCPLCGAMVVMKGIKDSVALVVGTDECAYFTKSMTITFAGYDGLHGRCYSVRLDTNDVTFGSVEKVEEAYDELMEEVKPSCVYLISTCLIEIIGDDFDALAKKLTKKYGIPVLPVHTEHFKCTDQLPGVERTLAISAELMEKQEVIEKINILGQRHGAYGTSELAKILEEENLEINVQLPNLCNVADIVTAPRAKFNVVVNRTALELAQKMQEKFGTPYVYFDKFVCHEHILSAYKELYALIGKEVPAKIMNHYEKVKANFEDAKSRFKPLTFTYGAAPFSSFEFIRLMTQLNLEPVLILTGNIYEEHQADMQAIAEKYNPYVGRISNASGMEKVLEALQPDIHVGYAVYDNKIQEKKIASTRFALQSEASGFELADMMIESLNKAYDQAMIYKGE